MKRNELVVWMTIIAVSIMPLQASSISKKKDELEAAQQSIKNSKNQLEQVELEKAQLEKEVDALDRKKTFSHRKGYGNKESSGTKSRK